MDEIILLERLKSIHRKLEYASLFHDRYMLHSAEDELEELIKEVEDKKDKTV